MNSDVSVSQGYADKSTTAKIQAKFTDLILINKHEVSRDARHRRTDA